MAKKNVRIRSMHDGFRRAGITHSQAWAYHNREDFSDDEWSLLVNEPNLTVQESAEGFAVEVAQVTLSDDPARLMELAKETDALLAAQAKKNARLAAKGEQL